MPPCRKQVAALVAQGMDLGVLRGQLGLAHPGDAPWDWTKAVRAALEPDEEEREYRAAKERTERILAQIEANGSRGATDAGR